jgi:protein-tyrosine phosphatase
MPPLVIDVAKADDRRDVVHRAVEALAHGAVIGVATETVYGVACRADRVDAIETLMRAKGRSKDSPLAVAIKGEEEALDFAPGMSPLARRLARRSWPGPVTIVVRQEPFHESVLSRVPAELHPVLAADHCVGLRVPAQSLFQDILSMMCGPIALTSANRSGQPPATSAAEVVAQLGESVRLVLDEGRCRYGQASTVVRVEDGDYQILREGVVSAATLQRLATFMVVFVCTGNTCRSPMAEELMRGRLAASLSCTAEALSDGLAIVSSAGISAGLGGRSAPEAIEVMHEQGLDLSGHQSQPLTDTIVRQADLIFAMTRGHRETIIQHWPEAVSRTHVLRPDGRDICDPIGASVEVYRECARQIDEAIQARLSEISL